MIAFTLSPLSWLEDADLAKVREEAERLSREWSEYWDTRAELKVDMITGLEPSQEGL